MITLLNVQRGAGKFKIRLCDSHMEMVLATTDKGDFVFPINKDSARKLIDAIVRVFSRDEVDVSCVLESNKVSLNFKFKLDKNSPSVKVSIGNDNTLFPDIEFRINEIIRLSEKLESYWKIFPVPAIGDVLDDPYGSQWHDTALVGFPRAAVAVFVKEVLKIEGLWSWSNGLALVVATDGKNTWYAIQYSESNGFLWLTKTFD